MLEPYIVFLQCRICLVFSSGRCGFVHLETNLKLQEIQCDAVNSFVDIEIKTSQYFLIFKYSFRMRFF